MREKINLKVRKFSMFPYLVRETLEDCPCFLSYYGEKLGDKINNDDIKLQMVLDLYGDFVKNFDGWHDGIYYDIYWEIMFMEIK